MSNQFGVTDQGFVAAQLTDVQTEINNSLIATFGANVNTNPNSIFGQLSGIMAEREALLWQAMQDVYNSQTPDTAFGASLDNVGALRGIPRLKAAPSTIQNVRLFGTAGTPIPKTTTQFSVQGSPTSLFALSQDATLAAGQSCIQTIVFSATPGSGFWRLDLNGGETADLIYNITAANLQAAIRTLPFCSGCTVTGSVGAGFTVNFLGPGTGGLMVQPQFTVPASHNTTGINIIPLITQAGVDQANVIVTAVSTGPVLANAGTLTVIATPITGLTNVLNTQDAVLGSNTELDNPYRARMAEELQIAGAGTVEAIRSKLLAVPGVESALVYENVSDIVDLNGRPGHSFECVINGGTDSDIANTIWKVKPAGIQTFGSSEFTITDSQGQEHDIFFSRPALIPIYMIVNLLVNSLYPSDGDTLVKDALANYVNGLGQGVSVIVSPQLVGQLTGIPGIDGVTILIGTAPSPTMSNNIPIVAYQQAITQTTFITVNDAPG